MLKKLFIGFSLLFIVGVLTSLIPLGKGIYNGKIFGGVPILFDYAYYFKYGNSFYLPYIIIHFLSSFVIVFLLIKYQYRFVKNPLIHLFVPILIAFIFLMLYIKSSNDKKLYEELNKTKESWETPYDTVSVRPK